MYYFYLVEWVLEKMCVAARMWNIVCSSEIEIRMRIKVCVESCGCMNENGGSNANRMRARKKRRNNNNSNNNKIGEITWHCEKRLERVHTHFLQKFYLFSVDTVVDVSTHSTHTHIYTLYAHVNTNKQIPRAMGTRLDEERVVMEPHLDIHSRGYLLWCLSINALHRGNNNININDNGAAEQQQRKQGIKFNIGTDEVHAAWWFLIKIQT